MNADSYKNILDISSRDEFRSWLMAHHASEQECYVELKRGKPVDDGRLGGLPGSETASR